MYKNSLYEKRSIPDRVKELAVLALFTVLIALVSLIVMDIIIYPLSYFAVTRKDTFNFIIKDMSIFIILIIMIFFFVRKLYSLRRDGLSKREIAIFILKRPLYYSAIGLTLLGLTIFITAFIYFILMVNNDLLIRLTNG
ncbi:MAG: hypothetical protein CVV44_15305 [Spirochaetae bacterium HGW-Spirochaetae-1]|jgi:hypothetical protein|nr:MAG: hypothetical protein CVV44_15305 [Spirochaetae bacterium HGW-Spirochaetae-1]